MKPFSRFLRLKGDEIKPTIFVDFHGRQRLKKLHWAII